MTRRLAIAIGIVGFLLAALAVIIAVRPYSGPRTIRPGDTLILSIVSSQAEPASTSQVQVAPDGRVDILGLLKLDASGKTCVALQSNVSEKLRESNLLVRWVDVRFASQK